jgi:thiol-disulfide isomerase/thioredoxin
MSLTKSSAEPPLGSIAPDFKLKDMTDARNYKTLAQLKGSKGTLIIFMCNHCPYVKHLITHFITTVSELPQGIKTIAINANDAQQYPEDGPEKMTQHANQWNFTFPYLYDETSDIAKAYKAQATPEFFLFNENLELQYHGRYDGTSPGDSNSITGIDLKQAVNALLKGELVTPQHPSIGCNIKWP